MRNTLVLLITLLMGTWLTAQVKIGDNPQNIDPASVLELESTDKVLVITRVTTAQMNAIVPSQGALCYNTELQAVHYYDGTQWLNIGSGGGTGGPLTADPIVNDVSTIVITPTATGDNLEVAPNSISSLQIIDGGVNGIDIQDGSIGPGKLQNNSVTEDKLSENSVGAFALDNDNIGVSAFNNDVGYITNVDLLSTDLGNALQLGSVEGLYYDEGPINTLIQNNTDAINAIGIPNLFQVLGQGNNALGLDIIGLADPTNPQDAATKAYVDAAASTGGSDNQNLETPTLAGNILTLNIQNGDPASIDLTPILGSGGNATDELTDISFNTITNILSLSNPATALGGTVDLSSLAGGGTGSTELVDGTTLIGDGTAGDRFRINPSTTVGQYLRTTAAGVVWDDVAAGGSQNLGQVLTEGNDGGAALIKNILDPVDAQDAATKAYVDAAITSGGTLTDGTILIGGTGDAAQQLAVSGDATLANDGALTITNDAITLAKINRNGANNGDVLKWSDDGESPGVGGWVTSSAASHSGTANSIFFADNIMGSGAPIDAPGELFWDPEARLQNGGQFGALGIGLDGGLMSDQAKVVIAEGNWGNDIVSYPLELQLRTLDTGSAAGMIFSVDANSVRNYGKGAIVFERTGGWAVGDFHFLQNDTPDYVNPDLTDKSFTIKNNKDILIYGGIDIDGIGLGAANEVLTSTGAGVTWGPAGGTTYTAGTGLTLTGTDFSVNDLVGEVTGPTTATIIANNAVTADKIANATILAEDLSDMGAGNNEVLKWNGTNWAPAADAGGTAYTAGTGLTLTGTDFTVNDLAGEVTGPTTATVIANNAVTADKIANATILAEDLSDMGAGNNEVLKWNGTNWAPAADAGGTAYTAGTGLTLTGADFSVNDLAGDVTGPTTAIVIANDVVTSAKILDGTIATIDIADGAIMGGAGGVIADNSITASDIQNDAVDVGEIRMDAVRASEIQTGAVETDEILDGTIMDIDISAGAAIDGTKVNPNFGAQNITTTGDITTTGTVDTGIIVVAGTQEHPDYVFEKYFLGSSELKTEYDFINLEEIESFVKKYHHLPGIKSAAVVKKEGKWNLSESNIQNLEKIEELFLHTIEQENKIKVLQSENSTLKEELESMKKSIQEIKTLLETKE